MLNLSTLPPELEHLEHLEIYKNKKKRGVISGMIESVFEALVLCAGCT